MRDSKHDRSVIVGLYFVEYSGWGVGGGGLNRVLWRVLVLCRVDPHVLVRRCCSAIVQNERLPRSYQVL